jgi:hypothetical protein
MATARSVRRRSEREELADIENWYRGELSLPAQFPETEWNPVRIGPTWQTDGDHWLLPEYTLGWQVLAWCGRWLQESRGVPWRFTLEQARFFLHWYSVDEAGRFVYRDGVLQRLKGWGKDPIGACLSGAEMLGPVRVLDWDENGPVGGPCEAAWVQTAAVSLKQTKNTMRLLPGLFTAEAKSKFSIQIGREQVHALGDERFMEALTSSPASLEGARSTFVLANETQHWFANNSGHDMADVIERNTTKSSGGASRTLRITNAYDPGKDSVAERDREAWEKAQAGEIVNVGLLYDSLEAPPEAPLSEAAAPSVVQSIRGDSVWLDTDTIVKSILDFRNAPSRSRRYWYNQIVAAEDAWADPQEWDACAAPDQIVMPDEKIVAFFDGSKSDDTTGLVGCRLSDGHLFVIGAWAGPPVSRGKGWIVDRAAVNAAVEAMFTSYKVVGFFADPADTRDDDGERFWEPLIDDWHRRYGPKLQVWATQSGDRRHSISWDMRNKQHVESFAEAAGRFLTEMAIRRFTHDGNGMLRQHIRNARRRPLPSGRISFGKASRESPRKVDLAVCAVGASMLRRLYLNKDTSTKQRSGRVW